MIKPHANAYMGDIKLFSSKLNKEVSLKNNGLFLQQIVHMCSKNVLIKIRLTFRKKNHSNLLLNMILKRELDRGIMSVPERIQKIFVAALT